MILAAGSGARLVVRTVARGSESGRELPGGPDVVLLDDEVHSLYSAVADLATPAGKRITAIFPRTGKRVAIHRQPRRRRAGRLEAHRPHRRHRRHAPDGRRGTAPAAGVAGPEQSRNAGGVAPSQLVHRQPERQPLSQPETYAARPPYWPPVTSPAQRAQSMNRWLGFLAVVCLFPARLGAQDTTTARRDGYRPPSAAHPDRHALAAGSARAGPGQQPGLPADAERRRPRQVGCAERLRQLSPHGERRGRSGLHRVGTVRHRRRPGAADLGVSSPPATAWVSTGSSTAGCSPAPASRRRCSKATEEDISGAGTNLRADITTQYLNALQATAQVDVARQQVVRNVDFLPLAQARYQVGQATLLDVRQAEVVKGQSDVALLRAQPGGERGQAGAAPPHGRRVAGRRRADRAHRLLPGHAARVQARRPADAGRRAESPAPLAAGPPGRGHLERARGALGVPADPLAAGRLERLHPGVHRRGPAAGPDRWPARRTDAAPASSTTRCDGARPRRAGTGLLRLQWGSTRTGTALSDPVSNQIRTANNVFPFDYTGQPFQANLTLSLPIFTGFSRSLRVSQARAQELDADEDVRARRLQVRSDVHGALPRRSRPPTRRSRCRRPTAEPPGTSSGWRRTATGWARGPRSRSPTRRTPCSRPKAIT